MSHSDATIERRDQERRLRLEVMDRVFDDYLSMVACEMRAPLRSILTLVRHIGEYDGEMDTNAREYADYIRASAEHMSVMLNDLKRPSAPRVTVGESRRSWQSVETR